MNVALPSLRPEFAVGEEPLRADDLAVLEAGRGFLEAVGSHRPQPLVGDELAALFVA